MKGQPVWIAFRIMALLLMGVAQGASFSFADTWYVRATGDDQNDCRSQDDACATLHETVDKALRDGSGIGDTIFVGAGSYITPASGPRKEGIIIGPGRGGTATAPFQLIADTAGSITGDTGVVEIVGGNSGFVIHASFVTVDGFTIRHPTKEAGVLVYGSNEGIVLQNLDVSGASGHGISLQGVPPSAPRRKDITILNAVIYNNGSQANNDYGLQIRSTDHSIVQGVTVFNNRSDIAGINIEKASHNVFEDIVVYNNTGDGIFVEEAHHNTFLNILAYNNNGSGIHFSQGGYNTVTNATIYGNDKEGYKTSSPDMTEQTLTNSIIVLNEEVGIDDRCLCTNHAFNILWMNTRSFARYDPRGADLTELMMDPFFLDPTAGDFRYQQTTAGEPNDSPAVDAGSDTAAHFGINDKTTRSDNAPDTGVVDLGYHY